jgi:transcriptional regulator
MAGIDSALPHGMLELLLLQAVARAPMHGYGIVMHVHEASNDLLRIEEGSVYPALHRLEQTGCLAAEWRTSEHNRRAKYYRLTRAGRRRLDEERVRWQRVADGVARVLRFA